MRLVFDKEIGFLNEKLGLELPSKACFMDRMIIYAYNEFHIKQPMYRLRAYEGELKIETEYQFIGSPVTWDEIVKANIDRLKKLEQESIELIESEVEKYPNHTKLILTSGGKDSSVTTYLVRKVLPECKGRFDNTSLDVADTYLHIKSLDNVEISNPDKGFYQWREENNFIPTRFARSCCSVFKEGQLIKDTPSDKKMMFFMGMRNDESNTRKEYQDLWKNDKWGARDWIGLLPIRKWSELDIWLYILWRDIKVNPKYEKGYSRVGCAIACPYYSQYTWILDEYWYPKLYKRWHDILEKDFLDNKKWTRLNCTLKEYHYNWNGGLVREYPVKEVVEEFTKHMGLNSSLAQKYFNNTCDCDKRLDSNDIGLSLKFFGRNTNKLFCKKCISKKLDITKEQIKGYIQDFKATGCSLF